MLSFLDVKLSELGFSLQLEISAAFRCECLASPVIKFLSSEPKFKSMRRRRISGGGSSKSVRGSTLGLMMVSMFPIEMQGIY